ncbi:hypothetical protein [Dermacoccus sp. Ellin185]
MDRVHQHHERVTVTKNGRPLPSSALRTSQCWRRP